MVIMLIAMLGKRFTAKLLSIALGYVLIVGLLPMSSIVSIQAMRMDAAPTLQTSVSQNNPAKNAGDNSPGSCCDAISAFSLACDFLVTQPACITVYGDSERVVNSAPVIQSIHIQSVTPPPKA